MYCSSIFQCMCVLGYCVVPLAVALTLCKVILLVDANSTGLFVVRSIIVLIALAWSIFGKFSTSCHLIVNI